MKNIFDNLTKKKIVLIIAILLIIFICGILMILNGVGVFDNTSGWKTISAKITKSVQSENKTYIEFTINNQLICTSINIYNVNYIPGNMINVLYNPSNPYECILSSPYKTLFSMCGGIVVVISIGGTYLLAKQISLSNKKQEIESLQGVYPKYMDNFTLKEENINQVENVSKTYSLNKKKFSFLEYEVYDSDSNLVYKVKKDPSKENHYIFENVLTKETITHNVGVDIKNYTGIKDDDCISSFYFLLNGMNVWDYLSVVGLKIKRIDMCHYEILYLDSHIGTFKRDDHCTKVDSYFYQASSQAKYLLEGSEKYLDALVLCGVILGYCSSNLILN